MRRLVPLILAAGSSAGAADFDSDIRPLLESRCLSCHSDANDLGGLSIATRAAAVRGGAGGPSLVAGRPDDSSLLTRMAIAAGGVGAMPPAGARVSDGELAAVREWIEEGAPWDGPLQAAGSASGPSFDESEMQLVRRIRARIIAKQQDEAAEGPEAYDEAVPETEATLRFVPVPAGEFLLGTPADQAGRRDDEGPQRRVRVASFWMGAHEVSWDAFRHFMLRAAEAYQDPDALAAGVSSPTPPYVEMSFGMGIRGFPAISMTQHAASKYAQWLSSKTGRFYRLPTEAEWEYACRAGSDTAYGFGDDPAELADHGWYRENSDSQYQPVGTKRANAWGLFDMHGNVWEWTLDRYDESYPAGEGLLESPWNRAERLYPRVARGGSWKDGAAELRCGSRRPSDDAWKMQDPQLPKSIWYHTDAPWLGFRVVRPSELPSAEMMYAYWNSAAGRK